MGTIQLKGNPSSFIQVHLLHQDFYECKVQAEVVKLNPGLGEETVKDITIVFDYEAENTLLCGDGVGGVPHRAGDGPQACGQAC